MAFLSGQLLDSLDYAGVTSCLFCAQTDSIETRPTATKLPDQKCNSNTKRKGGNVPKATKF